jgi:hypothetical protein
LMSVLVLLCLSVDVCIGVVLSICWCFYWCCFVYLSMFSTSIKP